jgi:predicted methyltransferase
MKKFNNRELYQLLQIIYNNGNIKRLTRKNITFLEIVDNIKELTIKGILYYNESKLSLSDEGVKILDELSLKYKNTEKDKWIDKELKSKLETKIDKDFVYLPNQNELYF